MSNSSKAALSPQHRRLRGATNNLPTLTNSFIGRKREKNEIKELLSHTRLLTLTGAGGSGKTRLSLEVASELVDNFKDGVWLIELASISVPNFVIHAIAKAFEVTEFNTGSMLESLKRYLQNKELLLLLDNFEHLVAVAPVVTDLLSTSRYLKVMITSREVLRLEGETNYPVLPLKLPDQAEYKDGHSDADLKDFESIRLFIERSDESENEFFISEENVTAVAEICRRLDGLPLAIELAAARLSVFQPVEILQRLRQHLPALGSGSRDLPERQQTLEATIDWSYDLLNVSERLFYRRLSVFSGGCTLEAAEHVCGNKADETPKIDAFEGLVALSEKNLLTRDASRIESRFKMLETVRQHALKRLEGSEESQILRRRHLEYFVQLTERMEHSVYGPEGITWIELINSESDNIRAAITFGEDYDLIAAFRIVGALGNYWRMAGLFTEGEEWAERLLKKDGNVPANIKAKAASLASYCVGIQGNLKRALELCEYALALSRETGDKSDRLSSLIPMGLFLSRDGHLGKSVRICEECVALSREIGDKYSLIRALSNLGSILATLREEFTRGEALLQEGLSIAQEIGSKFYELNFLTHLAGVALVKQDYKLANSLSREALLIADELHTTWYLQISFGLLAASTILGERRPKRAARLFGAAAVLKERIVMNTFAALRPDIRDKSLERIHQKLDTTVFQEEWSKGKEMTLDEAVEYALEDD